MYNTKQTKHEIAFDIMRILGCLGVIFIHVSVILLDNKSQSVVNFDAINFYNSLGRFAVPLFIMISGSILLNPSKPINISIIKNKYIMRIIKVFVFWSALYAISHWFFKYRSFTIEVFREVMFRFFKGNFHLWYLYLLFGLYLLTPFCRKITEDKELTEYFLVLWLVFYLIIPIPLKFLNIKELNEIYKIIDIQWVSGYLGYYILGYYLYERVKLHKLTHLIWLIIISICALALTIIGIKYYNIKQSIYGVNFFNITLFLYATSLFLMVMNMSKNLELKNNLKAVILSFGSATFGIYLIHAFFIALIKRFDLVFGLGSPWMTIPFCAIAIFFISYVLVIGLQKIIWIKQFIV